MPIDYKCDKRRTAPFKSGDKYFAAGFDLYIHEENGINAPLFILQPNIVALLLNISDEALDSALKIYNEELSPSIKYVKTTDNEYFNFTIENNEQLAFDMVENLFIAIVFAYSSVEAFVNNLIPKDFSYEKEVKKNMSIAKIICKKEYIERNYSLEYKINKILPEIYQFDIDTFKTNIEDKKHWDNFSILVQYRHKIIHPRTEKIEVNKFSQIKFIAEIFYDGINTDLVKSSRELIKILTKKVYDSPNNVMRSPHIPLEFLEEVPSLDDYMNF